MNFSPVACIKPESLHTEPCFCISTCLRGQKHHELSLRYYCIFRFAVALAERIASVLDPQSNLISCRLNTSQLCPRITIIAYVHFTSVSWKPDSKALSSHPSQTTFPKIPRTTRAFPPPHLHPSIPSTLISPSGITNPHLYPRNPRKMLRIRVLVSIRLLTRIWKPREGIYLRGWES